MKAAPELPNVFEVRKRTANLRPELRAHFHAEARSLFYQSLPAIAIREKTTPLAWAQRERWLAQGASPLSMNGPLKYDVAETPWCAEPMEAAVSPDVQITALWFASAMAKTEIAANCIGFCIDEEPSRIIVAYPIDKSAETFSKDVLQTSIIDATPSLRAKVREAKSRDSGNTIAHKKFPGGSISVIAAGSPSNFRLRRARFVYGDEIDAMPGSVGNEGDPIFLLFKRAEGFADAIKLLSSTATVAGHSRIEWWYLQSDQRKWFCPCRRCGHLQFLKWAQVKWPGDNRERAIYECESDRCGAEHDDKQRVRMVKDGVWKPTAAFAGVRGYWLNGINSTMPPEKGFRTKLHQFAEDAHRAKHSQNPKETTRVWVNTFLAETTTEELDPPVDWGPLFARRETYIVPGKEIVLPEKVRVLIAAVDVQANRFECEVVGWGRDEESWAIEHVQIAGNPEGDNSWNGVEAALLKRYRHASGVELEIALAFVDSGKWSDWVYRFVKRPNLQGRAFAIKGASSMAVPIIGKMRPWGRWARGYLIGTHAAKEVIYGRAQLAANEDGSFPVGFMHFPKTYDGGFFQQMLIERARTVFERGQAFRRYEKVRDSDRNEALDLRVYGLAAFRLQRWDWDALDAAIAEAAAPKSAEKKASERRERGRGFVGRWRK